MARREKTVSLAGKPPVAHISTATGPDEPMKPPPCHDRLPQLVEDRLRWPLPGRSAQRQLAPESTFGRHHGPPPADVRRAAVIAVFARRGAEWRLLLTERPDHLPDHAGQVCFPGGRLEKGESEMAGALREFDEELGPPPDSVRVLGRLTPLYIFGSNFWVSPWVGVLAEDARLAPNPVEVANLIEFPVSTLLDATAVGEIAINRFATSFRAPCFFWPNANIWGATSMILAELRTVIRQALPPSMGERPGRGVRR